MKSKSKSKTTSVAKAKPEQGSKLDQVEALLRRPQGASIADMMTTTGWQQHSVRGALAGAIKKRGHKVASDKVAGVRRYRIEPAA